MFLFFLPLLFGHFVLRNLSCILSHRAADIESADISCPMAGSEWKEIFSLGQDTEKAQSVLVPVVIFGVVEQLLKLAVSGQRLHER